MRDEYEGFGEAERGPVSLASSSGEPGELDSEQEIRLTTLADLSLLLLTFFIALFAFSDQSQPRFESYMASIREFLTHEPAGQGADYGRPANPMADRATRLERFAEREALLREQFRVYEDARELARRPAFQGLLTTEFDEGAIVLRLPSTLVFDDPDAARASGPSGAPGAKGRAALVEVRTFLAVHPDQVANVRDHADPADMQGTGGLEASSLRAVGVLRTLLDLGIEPRRVTATGMAGAEPLSPGLSEEQRGRNRRVEITLEKRQRR